MNGLRARLREITESGTPNDHPQLIAQIREAYGHSIEVVASPAPIGCYTCAMHALDLVDNEDYERIVMASPKHVFASPSFVQRLIVRGTLKQMDHPKTAGLVVYRSAGAVAHIGNLLSPERVESKWGIGHLYRHDLLEVPSQYGDELEFFTRISVVTVLDELVEFARENGVEFENNA